MLPLYDMVYAINCRYCVCDTRSRVNGQKRDALLARVMCFGAFADKPVDTLEVEKKHDPKISVGPYGFAWSLLAFWIDILYTAQFAMQNTL